jgi:hypothetical protein
MQVYENKSKNKHRRQSRCCAYTFMIDGNIRSYDIGNSEALDKME